MSSTPTSLNAPIHVAAPSLPLLKRRRVWAVIGLLLIALVGLILWPSKPKEAAEVSPLFDVKGGPLVISITSSGSFRNADTVTLKNEVEGMTTILHIAEEGSHAKKGELLVELDSSQLQDRKVDQEIKVENDKATYIKAQETLEITKKQGESDVKSAEVSLELALLDMEKYTGVSVLEILGIQLQPGEKPDLAMIAEKLGGVDWVKVDLGKAGTDRKGEYQKEYQEADNKITIANGELKRAQTKFAGSQQLRDKGYISQTELEADQLDLTRRKLELSVSENELQLLEKYTKRRKLAELMNEVDEKAFGLKKAQHEAGSNVVDAQAQLASKKISYEREVEKLDKLRDQIAKCKLYAPVEGMVVYATSGSGNYNQEPLKEGGQVRERQELIRIPTAGSMIADVKIHESVIEKVREDLPAIVTTDALPGREFHGVVKKVGLVPDSQDRWLNPNAKVYNTEIAIEGDTSDLKPGMSCTTEIVVDKYDRTAFVPLQAVQLVAGKPTVYVRSADGKTEPRTVETGLDNTRMVRVISGLTDGEQVLLNPPLPPATKPLDSHSSLAANLPPVPPKPAATIPNPSVANAPVAPAIPTPPAPAPAPATAGGEGAQRPQGRPNIQLTAEQEALRKKLEGMTAEQKREYFQSAEGQKLMQQFRSQLGNRGGGQGAPRGAVPGAAAPAPAGGNAQ